MLVGSGGDRRDAGARRLAIDMHRTGAALRHASAELGAVQADDLADRPERGMSGSASIVAALPLSVNEIAIRRLPPD
jgi:hypothetical protein